MVISKVFFPVTLITIETERNRLCSIARDQIGRSGWQSTPPFELLVRWQRSGLRLEVGLLNTRVGPQSRVSTSIRS